MTEPRYVLSKAEREVIIRFDAEERIAHVYTSDPVYMRFFDKFCKEDPNTFKCVQVDTLGYFKRYTAPADRLSWRKAPSEAQREAARKKAAARITAKRVQTEWIINPTDSDQDFIFDPTDPDQKCESVLWQD